MTSDNGGTKAGATDDDATDDGAARDGVTDAGAANDVAIDDAVTDDATDDGATDDATDGGATDDATDGGATTRVPMGTETACPTPGFEGRVCRVSFGSSRPSSEPPFEGGSAANTEKLQRGNITTVIAATPARTIVRFAPPTTICFSSEMTDT